MVKIKSALELLAFLQVIFAIYGICGAYEQNYIDDLQFAEYLLIFIATLTVNIIAIKALTAAIESTNYHSRNPKATVQKMAINHVLIIAQSFENVNPF